MNKPERVSESVPVTIDEQITQWDNPHAAEDVLNRSEFAARIASGLRNWKSRESLVVGIYGPWGSGKTWLLDHIIRQEQLKNDFDVCNFNPWYFESNEQIIAEFFSVVLDRLKPSAGRQKKSAKERANLWGKLGQISTVAQIGLTGGMALAGVPPIPPGALGAIGKLLAVGEEGAKKLSQEESLSSLRDKLVASFSQPDAPKILVVIDDLDRLTDGQIQMVFRLVKVSANFPNIHYVILGERKQLARALNSVSGGDGDRYLEKIVQIPITLPEADPTVIKGRLWEGLECIGRSYDYKLVHRIERFESFWRYFLKIRLTNLRSVHRLLAITGFHASSLYQQERLEVDLLDLLAIDFLRMFAPKTYGDLASNPLDTVWFLENQPVAGSSKTSKDSEAALEICRNSELGEASAFYVIAHLFPGFSKLLPEFTQTHTRYFNDHQKYKLSAVDRPIWHEEVQPLYFQLTLDASLLPRSAYERFCNTQEPIDIIRIFEEWGRNGWRRQLISRLNEDTDFLESPIDPSNFLLALSSVSDDLDSDRETPFGSELSNASRLWLGRFSTLQENRKLGIIQRVFQDSTGVSIPLLLLEYLRDKNDVKFCDGIEAPSEIPVASAEQIERLTDILFPEVKKRFWRRTFPVSSKEGDRFYRLAHALGPERTEKILTPNQNDFDEEACFAIILMTMRSLSPSLRLNLFDESSVSDQISINVFENLLRFASSDFWHRFVESTSIEDNRNSDLKVALLHVKAGKNASSANTVEINDPGTTQQAIDDRTNPQRNV